MSEYLHATLSNDVSLDIDGRHDPVVLLSQQLQTKSVMFHFWSF